MFKVLKPFLVQGMNQIKYLASFLELPLQGEKTLDTIQPGLLASRTYQQMLVAQNNGTWTYSVNIALVLFKFAIFIRR